MVTQDVIKVRQGIFNSSKEVVNILGSGGISRGSGISDIRYHISPVGKNVKYET